MKQFSDIDELLRLYNLKYSNVKIAKELGIDDETVKRALERLGFKAHSRKEIVIVNDNFAECYKCNNIMPLHSFSLMYGKNSGKRRKYCNKCRNEQTKSRRNVDNSLYFQYRIVCIRAVAKKNNLNFNLTKEYLLDLWELQGYKCFYSDLKLTPTKKQDRKKGVSLSIDKVIPELGYVQGNIVLCAQRINVIKSNTTLQEMKKWMPDWYRRLKKAEFVTVI